MLTIDLRGGLGNQLFQMCAGKSISISSNKDFYIDVLSTPWTPHSSKNYLESIFRNFKSFFKKVDNNVIVKYDCLNTYNQEFIQKITKISEPIKLHGWFQDYNITDVVYEEFIKLLCFDKERLDKKYPNISSTVFLHVRGGDYLTTDLFLDFTEYYKKAISLFPGKKISVFTNDINHAKQFLKDFDYEIINENEEDSLYLMSKCEGGICANSTFSWWGAYLNKNRKIVIPSKWSTKLKWHDETFYVTNWIII